MPGCLQSRVRPCASMSAPRTRALATAGHTRSLRSHQGATLPTTDLSDRFPPPDRPFAGDYAERHRALVGAVLGDPGLLVPFTSGAQLPDGYGVGFDERVVEYPWLLTRKFGGRVLDAGSALNHEHLLDRFVPEFDTLTI